MYAILSSDSDFAAIKAGSGLGRTFDPSVAFYPEQYCPVVESMPLGCFEASILEMFAVDGEYSDLTDRVIENLTQEQVIEAINTVKTR